MASTITRSQFEHAIAVPALRSYLAEFISTFLFVFSVVGSVMSSSKTTTTTTMTTSPHGSLASSSLSSALVAEAMAHSFALFVAVYIASNVSTGYLNPAVTFGLAVGGRIGIPTAMFYWVVQLVASTVACLLLRLITAGNAIPTTAIATEMTGFGGSVLEGVLTFALVYTVYAAGDPRRGSHGVVGPIAIGFVAGANVLAAGPFTGGSMNPARSFGSAVISGDFKNQAVYWVGPLIGGGLAGLVYQNAVFPSDSSRAVGDGLVI